MSRRRLRIGAGLVVAGLAALAAWTLRPAPERREWVTAAVERGSLVASVAATGTVNPVKSVIVGTYVSGPVAAIDVDFNSPVRRGQRIAKIDPRNFVGKVEQARASLADAQAQVRKAQAELALRRSQLERQEKLATSQVLSAEELDVARSSAKQADAQVALAQAEIEKARAALKDAEVNLGYTDMRYRVMSASGRANGLEGQSQSTSIGLLYPWLRSRISNVYLNVSHARKELVDRSKAGTLRDKTVAVSALGLSGDTLDILGGGGLSTASLSVTSGRLDLNWPDDRNADAGASGYGTAGHYRKLSYSATRLQKLSGSVTLYASLNGQKRTRTSTAPRSCIWAVPLVYVPTPAPKAVATAEPLPTWKSATTGPKSPRWATCSSRPFTTPAGHSCITTHATSPSPPPPNATTMALPVPASGSA